MNNEKNAVRNDRGNAYPHEPKNTETNDNKTGKAAGVSQKIDGNNPYANEDTVSDEEIKRETLEKK